MNRQQQERMEAPQSNTNGEKPHNRQRADWPVKSTPGGCRGQTTSTSVAFNSETGHAVEIIVTTVQILFWIANKTTVEKLVLSPALLPSLPRGNDAGLLPAFW